MKQNRIKDYTGKLAGQIEKETGYSDESRERLLPYVSSAWVCTTRPTKRIREEV